MKFLCTSVEHLPTTLKPDERAFTLFKNAKRKGVGTIAKGWRGSLKRKGFAPPRRLGTSFNFASLSVRRTWQVYAARAQWLDSHN
jgi:hypothetical protein